MPHQNGSFTKAHSSKIKSNKNEEDIYNKFAKFPLTSSTSTSTKSSKPLKSALKPSKILPTLPESSVEDIQRFSPVAPPSTLKTLNSDFSINSLYNNTQNMAMVRKKEGDKYLEALRELITTGGGNRQCFDCGQKGPTYVNMTIGSFVCTRCSGVL